MIVQVCVYVSVYFVLCACVSIVEQCTRAYALKCEQSLSHREDPQYNSLLKTKLVRQRKIEGLT